MRSFDIIRPMPRSDDAYAPGSGGRLTALSAFWHRYWKVFAAAGLVLLVWLIHLDRQVAARFRSELFPVASRLYSRPLELAQGLDVERTGLVDHLRRVGYRERQAGPAGPGEFVRADREITIGRRPFAYVESLAAGDRLVVKLDRKGRVRRLETGRGKQERALIEPEVIGSFYGEYWLDRRPLSLDVYPQHLIDALLAMEDRRFYEHSGIDLRRIGGAFLANLSAGRVTQGGSTLTQQLVKNLYLSSNRSLVRKLREAPMALLLELHHSKDEILEAYLNEIYLGQRGPVAIHGMGAASQHYFGKDAAALSLAESAFLVGLIHGPGLYSPDVIDEDQQRRASARPVVSTPTGAYQNPAPYFLSSLRRILERGYGEQALEEGGYTILTTLDPRLQRIARRALRGGLEELERRHARLRGGDSHLQAALVAIEPRSGEIRAMVGGRDFGASQFNRADQARRQPGSAFKPIVALAALSRVEGGAPDFTLASLLDDAPMTVTTPAGDWSPANYSKQFHGRVSLREALARSLNVPFVRVGQQVGPERIVEVARRLGIESELDAVPSLALGSSVVSPLELTGAYAVLAAEGSRHEPVGIGAVIDAEGGLVQERDRRADRVFSREEIHLVTSALESAVDLGTGKGLRRFGYRGAAAGKTGTTNDERDAWFVGYTPELAIGVWVGFDDNRSHGLTGAQAALPIFAKLLIGALGQQGGAGFEQPSQLEEVKINRKLGVRAGWGCKGEREIFLAGTEPEEWCGEKGLGDWLKSRLPGGK
jgi:penicillin-binding protein 1B